MFYIPTGWRLIEILSSELRVFNSKKLEVTTDMWK